MKTFTIQEASEYLQISYATIRNWIKSGLLPVSEHDHRIPQKALDAMSASGRLTKRRNKTAITKRMLYSDYLQLSKGSQKEYANLLAKVLTLLKSYPESKRTAMIPYLLVEYCLSFLIDADKCPPLKKPYVFYFMENPSCIGIYEKLYQDLVNSLKVVNSISFLNIQDELSNLLSTIPYIPFQAYQDLPGWLYISLSALGTRKRNGVYYTPARLANQLITALPDKCLDGELLDPACGTGQFLLACVEKKVSLSHLYGQDMDPVAVCLARITLACNTVLTDISTLYTNITCEDSLLHFPCCPQATIIGNPPWGSSLSSVQMKHLQHSYKLNGNGVDTSAFFIEAALQYQQEGCIISYLLPQSLLEVHLHQNVRDLMLSQSEWIALSYLGNCFSGVDCPSIRLTIKKETKNPGIHQFQVQDGKHSFLIHNRCTEDSDCLMLHSSDETYHLVQKITELASNAKTFTTLAGQATFALGIVTGNNQQFLKSSSSVMSEMEPVLRGENLIPYGITGSISYLQFQPASFQQCAKEEYYRAKEKLLYRFIGKKLIFTYDDQQTLTLNSANVLIPQIPGLSIHYILAVLNSQVANFYIKTKYPSMKLLRQHIESLPIPIPDDDTQTEIVSLVNLQLTHVKKYGIMSDDVTKSLEEKIYDLYHLSQNDICVISE